MQHAVVSQCGNWCAGLHVLAKVYPAQTKLATKRCAHQALGNVFFRLCNQSSGLVIGRYVLFVLCAGHGLATQALGAIEVGAGQAQGNPAAFQFAAQWAIVELNQRCTGSNGLTTGEMHFGDASGHFRRHQHLMICDYGADCLDRGRQHLAANGRDLHCNRGWLACGQSSLFGSLLALTVIEVESANGAEQGECCQCQRLGEGLGR
ncbi:hypothetical protein D3C76_1118900 [compost metagenome]